MTSGTSTLIFHPRPETDKVDAPVRPKKLLLIVPPYRVLQPSVSSRKSVRSFLAFPYGVLTLATYVQRHSRALDAVSILDLNIPSDTALESRVEEALRSFLPDVVGMSLMFDVSYRHVAPLAAIVKNVVPDAITVLGGAAVTASYADILEEQPDVDALCYSEGEKALTRLLDAPNPDDELANNPWVTRRSLASNSRPSADYIEQLDSVIDIDYRLIDISAYSMKEAFSPFATYRNDRDVRQFFVVTSRGCPFKCIFCAEPSYHGRSMRYASIDAVIAHVEDLVKRYGLNVLTIYDDQLLLDTERAKDLFRRLAKLRIRVEMPNGVTAVFIDQELAQLMKAAGVDTIFLALESGSEHVLKHIIKKPIRLDRIKPIIENLHANDIFVQAFFINGFPGETEEDRQATYNFIRTHGIDWSLFNYATPLRGTELYRICEENGWIDERYIGIGKVDMTDYIIRAPGIDPEKIQEQNYQMNLDVNFVNNHRMQTGDFETAVRCFREVIDRHPTHAFAHYYLAKALERQNPLNDQADHHRRAFHAAVGTDPNWAKYARQFGLISSPIQSPAQE